MKQDKLFKGGDTLLIDLIDRDAIDEEEVWRRFYKAVNVEVGRDGLKGRARSLCGHSGGCYVWRTLRDSADDMRNTRSSRLRVSKSGKNMRKVGKSDPVKLSSRCDHQSGSCDLTGARETRRRGSSSRPADASTVHEPTLLFFFHSSELVYSYQHLLIDRCLLYPLESRLLPVGADALVNLLWDLYIELGILFSLSSYFSSHVVFSHVGLYRPQMPRQSFENTKPDFFPLYMPPGASFVKATESMYLQSAPCCLFKHRLYDYTGGT
jgi:hypothetical protein